LALLGATDKRVEQRERAFRVAGLGKINRGDHDVAPTSQFTSHPFIRVDFVNRCGTPVDVAIITRDVRGRVSSTSVHGSPRRIAFENRRRATYREFESLLLRH
jgi:hypothetical protein